MKDHRIVVRLLILWLFISLYVTLHEGGHALAVLGFGGQLNNFEINLLNAHISYTGDFSVFQRSIINLAGFGFPYLIWIAFISVVPKRAGRILEYLKVYSAGIMGTMLPWVVIPWLYFSGTAPAGDDVTKFMEVSSFNGVVVSLVFMFLLIVSFMIWRGKTNNIREIIRGKDSPFELKRGILRIMCIISFAFLFFMVVPWNQVKQPAIAEGFDLLCEANLKGLEGPEIEMAKFWVEKPQMVGIQIIQKRVSAQLIDFKLVGSNGRIIPFIHGEVYKAGSSQQKGFWELEAGEYRFMLNCKEIKGKMFIYVSKD